MKRTQSESEAAEVEPHVFDHTNGVVDLGSDPRPAASEGDRNRTVSGIAMLSTQKP